MLDFNTKLAKVHAEIQEDTGLVRRIYEIAEREGLKKKKYDSVTRSFATIYYPVETFNEMPIGLDLNERHVPVVFEILAKMRILYDLSEGKADLLSVYASLDNNSGILSENVDIFPYFKAKTLINKLDPILRRVFSDLSSELERTTFWTEKKGYVRNPIVDLDHVFVKDEFRGLFKKYTSEYTNNPDFTIKKK